MSYLIPKDSCTLTDLKQFRSGALESGIARAAEKLSMSKEELTARQALNVIDFGAALEQWNTAALAAVGTTYSCFQAIAAPTLANNKVAVFWGVSVETTPVPVSRLTFRLGGATGNIIAEFDLEQMVNSDTIEGYFNQPICIDPTMTFAAQVTCRIATGVLARVQLKNYVIEPVGQFIA